MKNIGSKILSLVIGAVCCAVIGVMFAITVMACKSFLIEGISILQNSWG